jgi:hypothetical protein
VLALCALFRTKGGEKRRKRGGLREDLERKENRKLREQQQ